MKRSCSILLIVLITTAVSWAQEVRSTSLNESSLDRYESFLMEEINQKKIAGAVSLIALNNKIVHHKAFGYSHLDQEDEMTNDQIFYIQSMTKPIISTAMMILYDRGHFLLDDPVEKYLPQLGSLKVRAEKKDDSTAEEALKQPIRIWHLLSHTAGFSHGLGSSDYDKKVSAALYGKPHANIQSRVDALLEFPLLGQPGEQWVYSASPDIVALLIEKFSGKSCDQFLREEIFEPLGMNSTGYNVAIEKDHLLAGLHQMNQEGILATIPDWNSAQGNKVFGGTHGLYSTAADYANFCTMILNHGVYGDKRILSRKSIQMMTSDHIEGLPYRPGLGFGLGFGIKTDVANSKLIGSEGAVYWSGLFNTYFFIDPAEKLIAILMTQSYPYNEFYSRKMRQFVYAAIE